MKIKSISNSIITADGEQIFSITFITTLPPDNTGHLFCSSVADKDEILEFSGGTVEKVSNASSI